MATTTKVRLRSTKLTEANVKAMFPGLDASLELTMFPKWSLTKKAPATEAFVGRKAIIIRDNGNVVANVFAHNEGECLNAYFPHEGKVCEYSTKKTQVSAINRTIKELRKQGEVSSAKPAESEQSSMF